MSDAHFINRSHKISSPYRGKPQREFLSTQLITKEPSNRKMFWGICYFTEKTFSFLIDRHIHLGQKEGLLTRPTFQRLEVSPGRTSGKSPKERETGAVSLKQKQKQKHWRIKILVCVCWGGDAG